uniref:Uncharacterized protein n=1 Tax=Ditylenchus dipsaci TaxID=166011 RepID=A0A915E933_9BILA
MRRFVEKISFKRLGVSTLQQSSIPNFVHPTLIEEYHAKRKLLKKQLKLQPRARRSVTATENGASSVQNSMLAEEELIPAQTMKAIVEMANKLQDMSQLLLNQNSMLVQQIVQMQAAKAATAPAAAGTAPAAAAPAGAAGTAATAPAAAAPLLQYPLKLHHR